MLHEIRCIIGFLILHLSHKIYPDSPQKVVIMRTIIRVSKLDEAETEEPEFV